MSRVRLLTFNIAHARGPLLHQSLRRESRLRLNLQSIARLIQRLDVDIVALQEVDENSRWSGSFNQLDYLREQTGLGYAVHGVHNRRGGLYHLNYGNALLSRWPVPHHENVPFGARPVGEKGFLFAEVDTPAGRLPLVNVHLNHRSRPVRLKQAARLMAFLDLQQAHRGPHWAAGPVLCGDLNCPAHTPDATALLLGHLGRIHPYTLWPQGRAGRTFPSYWPQRALDYIYLPESCHRVEAQVVRSHLSDHRPVLVQFMLPAS
jgi:endonuclease/exonuclease/phosphatase family metal-dependent hydrolase